MTIPALPPAPALGDSPEVFNTKAFEFVAALDDWGTAANALAVDVNADAAAADADAATATTQAGIATTGANTATTQAGIATTKAGEAATSANSASGSATAANLRAIAAAESAASAATQDFANFQSGGTANGVAYLNGSKVLTTGSALQFDGTNLGLGVTPSAWQSGFTALQVKNASVWSTGNDASLTANAYVSGGVYKYIATSAAARLYLNTDGSIAFFQAPSGTAGTTASFTQAMTLDASGNLGVGIATATQNGGGASKTVHINASGVSDWATNHYTNGTTGTTGGDGFVVGLIGNDGNAQLFNYENTAMVFSTNATERARIDSSGNLLVGTTSTSPSGGGVAILPQSGNTAVVISHASGVASGEWFTGFRYNSSSIGSISQNGTTAVAYNTTSDYRLKENVQPLSGALAKVIALKPCTYTWKSAPDEIGEGFIAHELAEVCPQAVTGEKDAVNEDGSIKPQSIDTSFLVATLTAAIQELNAKFEAYKAAHP